MLHDKIISNTIARSYLCFNSMLFGEHLHDFRYSLFFPELVSKQSHSTS